MLRTWCRILCAVPGRVEVDLRRAAASALGLSLSAFLDLAKEHAVPVTRYALEDWLGDRAALDKLADRR